MSAVILSVKSHMGQNIPDRIVERLAGLVGVMQDAIPLGRGQARQISGIIFVIPLGHTAAEVQIGFGPDPQCRAVLLRGLLARRVG